MEIILSFIEVLPLFFVLGHAVVAGFAKNDLKAIKHLLWAITFLLALIVDVVI